MVEEPLLLEEETPHDEINDNSIIAGLNLTDDIMTENNTGLSIIAGLNVTHDIMTENNTTIKTSPLDGFK